MPNLEYDPQNPSDLLGRPIAEGDIIAIATTFSRSAALAIGVIEKINFTRKKVGSYGNEKCEPFQADRYTLRIRPLKSTNMYSYVNKVTGETCYSMPPDADPRDYEYKSVTFQHVKNAVKLDLTREEVEALVPS